MVQSNNDIERGWYRYKDNDREGVRGIYRVSDVGTCNRRDRNLENRRDRDDDIDRHGDVDRATDRQ